EAAEDLEAVNLGQLEVQENYARAVSGGAARKRASGVQEIEGFGAIADHVNAIREFVLSKGMKRKIQVALVCFDNTDVDGFFRHTSLRVQRLVSGGHAVRRRQLFDPSERRFGPFEQVLFSEEATAGEAIVGTGDLAVLPIAAKEPQIDSGFDGTQRR